MAILGTLILYALLFLDLSINTWVAVAIFSSAQATQWLASKLVGIPYEWRSALITSCSLALLLRTELWWLGVFAAVIAMSSKFLLRVSGKHLFNPANIALVTVTLLFDTAWLSTGQWGQLAWFGLLLAGAGWFVTTRSSRFDITLAFLLGYGLLLLGRALWLGDPLTIPVHQLQNGALLIFAFFMISDPASTPDSRSGRILFALLTAILGFSIQFGLYQSQGIIYALAVCCLFTPIIDKLLPGSPFSWQQASRDTLSIHIPFTKSGS